MMIRTFVFGLGAAVVMTASMAALADADNGKQPGVGPNPQLPEATTSLVPTINVARAIGWTIGEKPSTPSDLAVTAYASGLDHPRWIYTLPNGDVLVAETNGPQRPQDGTGLKA
jgi:glucose/arabinose dehydrogenase